MAMMTKTTVTPYFMLNGKAKEVMTFYHQAIGGDLLMRTYGEAMAGDCPPAMRNLVMHASLKFGDFVLMASDAHPDTPTQDGSVLHLAIGAPDAELARLFVALSQGGEVTQALSDAPWGGKFGALTDRYGFQWMFASDQG